MFEDSHTHKSLHKDWKVKYTQRPKGETMSPPRWQGLKGLEFTRQEVRHFWNSGVSNCPKLNTKSTSQVWEHMSSTSCSCVFQLRFCYRCLPWGVSVYCCCFGAFSNYRASIVVSPLPLVSSFSVIASCGGHSTKAFWNQSKLRSLSTLNP